MKSAPLPVLASRRRDLLRLPVLGKFLAWKHARTTLQIMTGSVALLVIGDGLFGPRLAARNAAGVLPWVHWRGLVVLALLVAGNLFCMACPFMLPRRLAKRLWPEGRPWPKRLGGKTFAVGLLIVFFASYEVLDLWASPWLTAWITIGYFVIAFAVDAVFRGAAFCKHVCPIGQFHFVHSTLSPLEVAVRDPATCASCATKDCIRGRWEGEKKVQSGCELWLYQPRKVGNTDCTFCLDCVQACPHDNVGILTRRPAEELWDPRIRSGVGRPERRPDLAALVVVLTFAAFVNAFGMVEPGYTFLRWAAALVGTGSEALVTVALFAIGLVALPAAVVFGAAFMSRALAGGSRSATRIATTYAYSLVPVGFGMWCAHYLYHFFIGALTIIPVAQSRLLAAGVEPAWALGPLLPESWLAPMSLGFLEFGLLVSLVVAYRIGLREEGSTGSAVRAALPWWGVAFGLAAVGSWLLFQPMELRGNFLSG